MRIFLTGGTGFIGQALTTTMRARGWAVDALVRDEASAQARWLAARGARLIGGDVSRRDGLRAAMSGADVVVHNAGVYELGANAALVERMREVNIAGTENVLGAAREAGLRRSIYVSTTWALGATGPTPRDERFVRDAPYYSHYEKSKVEAHEKALAERVRGLPLSIAMPNAVVGANDHAIFGYLLRLYLMHRLPPISWGADSIFTMVDVHALAEGICLAIEKAPMGEDFLLCGAPLTLRELFAHWARHPGGARRWLFLPRWLALPTMAMMEPLLRALSLPAFLSRETVRVGTQSLNYSSAKAQRMLGWTHPAPAQMWDAIIDAELSLMAARRGMLQKLRPAAALPG